jgi:Protein of unknown function (DUF1826)
MRPDRRTEAGTPRAHLMASPCPTAQRLSRDALRSGPLSVMARVLEPAVLTALDAVAADRLPRLCVVGDVDSVRRILDRGLEEAEFGPGWLAEWLSEDVIFLARLFQELTKALRLQIRLEAVEDDACRRFHTDNVRFRLVTTYRGPGTEWISPHLTTISPSGAPVPTDTIRRLDRGHIAIMRGGREATAESPGLLHRSPPIAGTGVTRLFLAIDDAADHEC